MQRSENLGLRNEKWEIMARVNGLDGEPWQVHEPLPWQGQVVPSISTHLVAFMAQSLRRFWEYGMDDNYTVTRL